MRQSDLFGNKQTPQSRRPQGEDGPSHRSPKKVLPEHLRHQARQGTTCRRARLRGLRQHRGWLSKSTAEWIASVITKFGAPTTPIVVRKGHTFEEEAPRTNASS